ncbi:MAG: glycosyltransferase family 9 protein [Gammaproteobacteria bacterium]|nr:glycosyltransferase family 9 protein [Gammaproteobacteria bacterium]
MDSATAGRRLSILLIRLSAIGDIVMATPLIGALRRSFPEASISWLVQPELQSLLAHDPDLDSVITWPRGRWKALWKGRRLVELWKEVRRFRQMLRNRRFDLVIDLQGLLKSGAMAWFSGAPQRIGLGSREGSRLLMTRVIERGGNPERIGSEYLYLAHQLGLAAGDFRMNISLSPGDEAHAAGLIGSHQLEDRFAVVCPFTTRPQKHWLDTRWVELMRRIDSELGLTPLILGGPGDQGAAQSMVVATAGGIVNLTGKTSLTEAAALIRRATLLIGVDTGLTHMGIAFGRPTLALFGSTCPYLDTTRHDARVIYRALPCSPCRRKPVCNGAFTCMSEIGVDEVLEQAAELLSVGQVRVQKR